MPTLSRHLSLPPFGIYQLCVMPLGLNGAPATFHRLMDQVIRGLQAFLAAYFNDFTNYSSTWEGHVRYLEAVFDHRHQAGLTVKHKSVILVMSHCSYLSHVAGVGTIAPELSVCHTAHT